MAWNPSLNAAADDAHATMGARHPDDHLPNAHYDFPNPGVSNKPRPYGKRTDNGQVVWDNDFPANYANLFTLTLSASTGGGTMPTIGTHQIKQAEVVTVIAQPLTNYEFTVWSGADANNLANKNSATTTITMDGDRVIHAGCQLVNRTLVISAATGGSASPAGTTVAQHGTVKTITATPSTWYLFSKWGGQTQGVNNVNSASTTLTMNADYTIAPQFVLKPTLDSDANGYIESDTASEGIIFLD